MNSQQAATRVIAGVFQIVTMRDQCRNDHVVVGVLRKAQPRGGQLGGQTEYIDVGPVVGLPMRTLYRMLNKLDVRLLCLLCFSLPVFSLHCGCSSEFNIVTKKEDTVFYSSDHEVRMGQSIYEKIMDEEKPVNDPLIQKRVEDIGKKIAAVCDRKEIEYHFQALEDDEINAFSLPGGYVMVFSGLIAKVANDDELAGVLAHEVGHIVARHAVKQLQGQLGYTFLRILTAVAPGGAEVGSAADAAFANLLWATPARMRCSPIHSG